MSESFTSPVFPKSILIIVGAYGSGKSEVSVNLARHLVKTQSEPVAITDLDIVNPYFRSREAAQELRKLGIVPIIPSGDQVHADLPIILPEVKGAIQRHDGKVVVDVGGDDVGARVLSSLGEWFDPDYYELLMVLNAKRPFTNNLEGSLAMMRDIEKASRLKFTGIISNTHLLEHTTPDAVLSGLDLALEVGRQRGLPVVFVSALASVLERMNPAKLRTPVLALRRSLLKPWERPAPAPDH